MPQMLRPLQPAHPKAADRLKELQSLRSQDLITPEEFAEQKTRILSTL
jgi:hypothetical protein